MPDMQSVNSSSIMRAGWDEPNILYVQFRGRETYRYEGISQETYDGLVSNPSPGGFFQRSIRPYVRGERV